MNLFFPKLLFVPVFITLEIHLPHKAANETTYERETSGRGANSQKSAPVSSYMKLEKTSFLLVSPIDKEDMNNPYLRGRLWGKKIKYKKSLYSVSPYVFHKGSPYLSSLLFWFICKYHLFQCKSIPTKGNLNCNHNQRNYHRRTCIQSLWGKQIPFYKVLLILTLIV